MRFREMKKDDGETERLYSVTGWRIVSEAKKKFYWRLFMPGKDRLHLVAYPVKMELE